MRRRNRSRCPNCWAHPVDNHPENGCVLAALVQIIRERETVPETRLLRIHARTDITALWNTLGPLLDRLEVGEFSK